MNEDLNEERNVRETIWRSAAYRVLMGSFAFDVPTIVLLWQANGFTMSDVMLLQSLFAAALAILEVPSGYFADRLGRSITLRIAAVALATGAALYVEATSFASFLAGEIFLAIGFSFASGADQALLYDSLKSQKRENEFPRLWARLSALGLFSWGMFSVLGGYVAAADLRAPLYLTVLGCAALVVVASGFKEPQAPTDRTSDSTLSDLKALLHGAFFAQRSVRWLMLFPAVILGCNQGVLWFYQPYFVALDIPVHLFGVIFGAFNMVAALASHYAEGTIRRCGAKGSVIVIVIALLGSLLVMSASISFIGLGAVVAQQWIRGFAGVAFAHQLNEAIDSKLRASTISLQSLISRASYAALIVPVGWWADARGMAAGILALAGLSAVLLILVQILCTREQQVIPEGRQEAVL